MNHNSIWIIIPLILSCSKEEEILTITHSPDDSLPPTIYELNLRSDSGQHLDSVTIEWNESDGTIEIDNDTCLECVNDYQFNVAPGEFRDVIFNLTTKDSTYTDTIQIFTRSVYPVTNLIFDYNEIQKKSGLWEPGEILYDFGTDGIEAFDSNQDGNFDEEGDIPPDSDGTEGNGVWDPDEEFTDEDGPHYHRILNWSPTKEPDQENVDYIIYRISENNIDSLLNIDVPNIYDNFYPITSLAVTDTSFVDSSKERIKGQDKFYYYIQVSKGNYTRNSFIDNYQTSDKLEVELNQNSVSTDKNDYIKISWNTISNTKTKYFYQYEILRSPYEENTYTSTLAIISNPTLGHFMDRTAGNGTSWYYSIATVDFNGNYEYSDFVQGWTKP